MLSVGSIPGRWSTTATPRQRRSNSAAPTHSSPTNGSATHHPSPSDPRTHHQWSRSSPYFTTTSTGVRPNHSRAPSPARRTATKRSGAYRSDSTRASTAGGVPVAGLVPATRANSPSPPSSPRWRNAVTAAAGPQVKSVPWRHTPSGPHSVGSLSSRPATQPADTGGTTQCRPTAAARTVPTAQRSRRRGRRSPGVRSASGRRIATTETASGEAMARVHPGGSRPAPNRRPAIRPASSVNAGTATPIHARPVTRRVHHAVTAPEPARKTISSAWIHGFIRGLDRTSTPCLTRRESRTAGRTARRRAVSPDPPPRPGGRV